MTQDEFFKLEAEFDEMKPIDAIVKYLEMLRVSKGTPLTCASQPKCAAAGYWPIWCLHCPPSPWV